MSHHRRWKPGLLHLVQQTQEASDFRRVQHGIQAFFRHWHAEARNGSSNGHRNQLRKSRRASAEQHNKNCKLLPATAAFRTLAPAALF
jgi:hypothetical protein